MFLALHETVPDAGGTLMLLAVGLEYYSAADALQLLNRRDATQMPRRLLTRLNFLLLDAHRVFVRFRSTTGSFCINLGELSTKKQYLR